MRIAAALIAVASFALPAGAAPMFQGLGMSVSALSADGRVAVGARNGGVRWTAETGIQQLWTGAGRASDVSDDGSVIVGNRVFFAVRWTESTGAVNLGTLPSGQQARFAPTGISGDGSVVVGFEGEGYRWTQADGFTLLAGGSPEGISHDGQVIYGSVPIAPAPIGGPPITQWARWSGAAWEPVPELSAGIALGSIANDASADGSILVGHGEDYPRTALDALLWSEATGVVSLSGGTGSSVANAVSADGRVVVGDSDLLGPFIWDAVHGMRALQPLLESLGLDLTGWTLTDAIDISDDGTTIVGNGLFEGGSFPVQGSWIAVIPEPSTGALLCAGLAAVAQRRRA